MDSNNLSQISGFTVNSIYDELESKTIREFVLDKVRKDLNHTNHQKFEDLQHFYKTQIDEMRNKLSELYSPRAIQAQKPFQNLEQKTIILEKYIGRSFYQILFKNHLTKHQGNCAVTRNHFESILHILLLSA